MNLVQIAFKYNSDEQAFRAYERCQEIIFRHDCDLSTYRILNKGIPTVLIVGEIASPKTVVDLHLGLIEACKPGTSADVGPDIWQTLRERRATANKIGPWVEGHYRTGKSV